MGGFLWEAAGVIGGIAVSVFWVIINNLTFVVSILHELLQRLCQRHHVKFEATQSPPDPPQDHYRRACGPPKASRRDFRWDPTGARVEATRHTEPRRESGKELWSWVEAAGHIEPRRESGKELWSRVEAAGHTEPRRESEKELWSIEALVALDGSPVFVGGPYNPSIVPQEAILHPTNCKLNRPLTKWYVVGYGKCQGIWQTWPEDEQMVTGVQKGNHESFKRKEEAKQSLSKMWSGSFSPLGGY